MGTGGDIEGSERENQIRYLIDNLKAIYVPKNKVDYYKKRFPADMHWLIVEEGSALPVKA